MENTSDKKKKSFWDIVLKVIIAALSALAGALGANAETFDQPFKT